MAISKEELYPLIREIVSQELEERIPIHKEIVDLKSTVERLILAQERTEKRIEELAEAQKKTEERLIRLESAVEALAEAQRKSEERLTRLESTVEALIEAQRKFEERLTKTEERLARLESAVEALAEAQRKSEERLTRLESAVEALIEAQRKFEERLTKTEERLARLESTVEALIEAQRKTEEEIRELTLAVKSIQKQVNGISKELGGLSHAIGFQLEDRAYRSLPNLLKRDFGIEVKERLIRKFIKNKKGEPMEINILGKGEKDGKEIFIVGEAKANLSLRHIIDFIDRLKDIKEVISGEILPIIVTYMTDPETEEFARTKGIFVYYSYDFEPIY